MKIQFKDLSLLLKIAVIGGIINIVAYIFGIFAGLIYNIFV